MSGPEPSLAQQVTRRELAALVDGPWAPRWYWREDLGAMQASTRTMGHPDEHPAAELRHYHRTEQWVEHPLEDDVRGRAWRYRPPNRHGGTR